MSYKNNKTKKILVRRNAALGDVLLATSVLPVLKKRYPDFLIDFETSCNEILQNNTLINKIIPHKKSVPEEYTHIFNLNDTYECKPHLPIFKSFSDVIGCNEDELHLSFDLTNQQRVAAEKILNENSIVEKKIIAIQSGASYWIKIMRPAFLEKLIALLRDTFAVEIVHLGSPKDPELSGVIDLRGKCSFVESAAILERCVAFIGHDSALIHLSKALSVPVIAFFGHTDPDKRICIDERDMVFTTTLSCKFCYHKRISTVIFPYCTMQPLQWQIVDRLLQTAMSWLSIKDNRYLHYCYNRLNLFQNNQRNGKQIACCMKEIETQGVFEKIINRLENVLIKK